MIFVAGDVASYHGDVQGNGMNVVLAGDQVTVYRGNIEPEDDVWITVTDDAAPIPVSAHELKWLSGKP